MCPLPLMSAGIGLILSRSSGGAMLPCGSAGKCLREEPGGMGRNELSANAKPPRDAPVPHQQKSGAFNAHNPCDGGSGLVQPVFVHLQPRKPPAEDCAPRRQAKNAIR